MKSKKTYKLTFILFIALLSVSTSSVIVRLLPQIPAVVIAFWRMALASAMLWLFSAVYPQGSIPKENKKKILLAGLFLGFHFASFFGAVKLTTIANATILGTTTPVFTLVFEKLVLKRTLNKGMLVGITFALVGIIIVHGGRIDINNGNTLGNLLALLGSFWMAIVVMLSENIRRDTGTLVYSRSVYLVAAGTLLLMSVGSGLPLLKFSHVDFGWFLMLGLVPTILGHTSFNYAIKYIPSSIIASIPLGETIGASFMAWIFFNEGVPLQTIIGGFLTLSGLYKITRNYTIRDFQSDNL